MPRGNGPIINPLGVKIFKTPSRKIVIHSAKISCSNGAFWKNNIYVYCCKQSLCGPIINACKWIIDVMLVINWSKRMLSYLVGFTKLADLVGNLNGLHACITTSMNRLMILLDYNNHNYGKSLLLLFFMRWHNSWLRFMARFETKLLYVY